MFLIRFNILRVIPLNCELEVECDTGMNAGSGFHWSLLSTVPCFSSRSLDQSPYVAPSHDVPVVALYQQRTVGWGGRVGGQDGLLGAG